MKTIILPTDFSKNSKHAINWALNFYQYGDAQFIIVNSYKTPKTSSSSLVSLTEILHKQSVEDLAKFKEEIILSHPNLEDRIHTKPFFGDVLNATNAIAEEVDGEVRVVVGAKGMTAVKELLVGSNTANLIMKIKMPLYVIPEQVNIAGFKRMALGIDYKNYTNKEVLKPLKAILESSSAELYPFYIERSDVDSSVKEEVLKELRAFMNLPSLHITSLTHDEAIAGIKEFIKKNNIDCLVSVNRKKSFFERLFQRSFSKELAAQTETALLILHDK